MSNNWSNQQHNQTLQINQNQRNEQQNWCNQPQNWGNNQQNWGIQQQNWGNGQQQNWGNQQQNWSNQQQNWGNQQQNWGYQWGNQQQNWGNQQSTQQNWGNQQSNQQNWGNQQSSQQNQNYQQNQFNNSGQQWNNMQQNQGWGNQQIDRDQNDQRNEQYWRNESGQHNRQNRNDKNRSTNNNSKRQNSSGDQLQNVSKNKPHQKKNQDIKDTTSKSSESSQKEPKNSVSDEPSKSSNSNKTDEKPSVSNVQQVPDSQSPKKSCTNELSKSNDNDKTAEVVKKSPANSSQKIPDHSQPPKKITKIYKLKKSLSLNSKSTEAKKDTVHSDSDKTTANDQKTQLMPVAKSPKEAAISKSLLQQFLDKKNLANEKPSTATDAPKITSDTSSSRKVLASKVVAPKVATSKVVASIAAANSNDICIDKNELVVASPQKDTVEAKRMTTTPAKTKKVTVKVVKRNTRSGGESSESNAAGTNATLTKDSKAVDSRIKQQIIQIKEQVVASKAVAPKVVASKTVASKTVASKTVASKTVASKTVASKTVASKTVASKTVASKTVASKTVAPKVVASKAVAPKVVAPKVSGAELRPNVQKTNKRVTAPQKDIAKGSTVGSSSSAVKIIAKKVKTTQKTTETHNTHNSSGETVKSTVHDTKSENLMSSKPTTSTVSSDNTKSSKVSKSQFRETTQHEVSNLEGTTFRASEQHARIAAYLKQMVSLPESDPNTQSSPEKHLVKSSSSTPIKTAHSNIITSKTSPLNQKDQAKESKSNAQQAKMAVNQNVDKVQTIKPKVIMQQTKIPEALQKGPLGENKSDTVKVAKCLNVSSAALKSNVQKAQVTANNEADLGAATKAARESTKTSNIASKTLKTNVKESKKGTNDETGSSGEVRTTYRIVSKKVSTKQTNVAKTSSAGTTALKSNAHQTKIGIDQIAASNRTAKPVIQQNVTDRRVSATQNNAAKTSNEGSTASNKGNTVSKSEQQQTKAGVKRKVNTAGTAAKPLINSGKPEPKVPKMMPSTGTTVRPSGQGIKSGAKLPINVTKPDGSISTKRSNPKTDHSLTCPKHKNTNKSAAAKASTTPKSDLVQRSPYPQPSVHQVVQPQYPLYTYGTSYPAPAPNPYPQVYPVAPPVLPIVHQTLHPSMLQPPTLPIPPATTILQPPTYPVAQAAPIIQPPTLPVHQAAETAAKWFGQYEYNTQFKYPYPLVTQQFPIPMLPMPPVFVSTPLVTTVPVSALATISSTQVAPSIETAPISPEPVRVSTPNRKQCSLNDSHNAKPFKAVKLILEGSDTDDLRILAPKEIAPKRIRKTRPEVPKSHVGPEYLMQLVDRVDNTEKIKIASNIVRDLIRVLPLKRNATISWVDKETIFHAMDEIAEYFENHFKLQIRRIVLKYGFQAISPAFIPDSNNTKCELGDDEYANIYKQSCGYAMDSKRDSDSGSDTENAERLADGKYYCVWISRNYSKNLCMQRLSIKSRGRDGEPTAFTGFKWGHSKLLADIQTSFVIRPEHRQLFYQWLKSSVCNKPPKRKYAGIERDWVVMKVELTKPKSGLRGLPKNLCELEFWEFNRNQARSSSRKKINAFLSEDHTLQPLSFYTDKNKRRNMKLDCD